jgi:microcystin-dependent protein
MSLPFTLNFTDSTYEYINGYYVIKFQNLLTTNNNVTGTITFTEIIKNISVICVAGGGKGPSSAAVTGGGGGGGSGIKMVSSYPGNVYSITVGYGATSVITPGGNSSVSIQGVTLINCTGGSGGNIGNNNPDGSGGTMTIGDLGGTGGRGAYYGNSENSWGAISVPTEIQLYVPSRYGGGGGRGSNTDTNGRAGQPGISGIGGADFYSGGPSATTYGSGSGGNNSSGNYYRGASGIVIMYFQYPQYKYNGLSVGGLEYPIGGLVAWVSNTIPDGWAVCDGSPYDTTKYEILFSILGSSSLPNLNAAFLCQTGYNSTYTISGPALRGYLTDSYKQHTHTITDPGHQHQYSRQQKKTINESGDGNKRAGTDASGNTVTVTADISVNNNSDDTETAPYCYGVKWLIKMG